MPALQSSVSLDTVGTVTTMKVLQSLESSVDNTMINEIIDHTENNHIIINDNFKED